MNKKEFEEISLEDLLQSAYGLGMDAGVIDFEFAEAWLEYKIKQARIDELENFIVGIIGESEFRDRKERVFNRLTKLKEKL